jgi:hypothetical protein
MRTKRKGERDLAILERLYDNLFGKEHPMVILILE